jgi:Zn-dependent peptidase ImmA (M78 family)
MTDCSIYSCSPHVLHLPSYSSKTGFQMTQNSNKGMGAEFVIRRARQLIKLSGLTAPPFSPERYAQLQGVVRVVKEDLGQTAGLLLPIENGYEISLNAKDSPVRQTLSCAHEIGHTFFLEKEGKQILGVACAARGRTQSNYWLENLCDLAAAELLMPASIFYRFASRYQFNIKSLLPLSKLFATSIQSTAIRLCDLTPRHCYLVSSEQCNSIELNEPILRNTWLTWSGLKETPPKTKGRLLLKPKVL